MKTHRIILFICLTLLLLAGDTIGDDITTPLEINGFKLGASIKEYEFLKYRHYLKEVMIDDIGGFRRGSISYGTCEHQKKFGEPEEFTGDAFGIILSWKWRFRDKDNNYILLTLQHNRKDRSQTMGNMVKLSMPDRVEAERKCFLKICETEKIECPVNMTRDDWDNLIPK
jgi:hypothetical protein